MMTPRNPKVSDFAAEISPISRWKWNDYENKDE